MEATDDDRKHSHEDKFAANSNDKGSEHKIEVVLIGDHVSDMIPGAHSCGVPLDAIKSYSKVMSSDVPYEADLEQMRPQHLMICLPRATVVQTSNGRDLAARSRRIVHRGNRQGFVFVSKSELPGSEFGFRLP